MRGSSLRFVKRSTRCVSRKHVDQVFGFPISSKGAAYKIIGYDNSTFALQERATGNELTHKGAFILTTSELLPWSVNSWESLLESDLSTVMQIVNQPVKGLRGAFPVRLVLLGTGRELRTLESKLKSPGVYMSQGVGFEVLNTAQACSTYNLLVDEGRQVVAAILPASG